MSTQEEKITSDMKNEIPIESAYRSNSSQFNFGTMMKQQIHEEYNSAYNHQHILAMINAGRAYDISQEPRQHGPVFVIGSGPSLDLSIKHLKKWDGGIVCSTSQALTLMYHGIEPDYIVALDPFSQWDELAGVDWSKTKAKLVAHPGVWPDLYENWPNKVLLYRQNIGRPDSFYATTQKHMYSVRGGTRDMTEFKLLILTELTLLACSPPLQVFVADKVGYGTVFLAGCDFGFPHNKSRFTMYTVKRPAKAASPGNAPTIDVPIEWEEHESLLDIESLRAAAEKEQNEVIKSDNGVYTQKIHLFYKKNFITGWRLSLKTMYTTDKGTITEIPYTSIEKVIKNKGKAKRQTPEYIKRVTEQYLARSGAFVIESEDGAMSFVETQNPIVDLYSYMMNMRKQLYCPKCGIHAHADDGKDHSGEPCARCGGKLELKNKIGIAKNMERIQELMKYVEKYEAQKKAAD